MKYEKGKKYRVVKEGGRFEGLLLFGEQSISGWSRSLKVGEILTCLGFSETQVFGANISGIGWTGAKVPDNAMVMQIWPFESIFRARPLPGLLEPYDEPADPLQQLSDTPPLEEIDEGHVVDLTSHLPEIKQTLAHEKEEIVDLTRWTDG